MKARVKADAAIFAAFIICGLAGLWFLKLPVDKTVWWTGFVVFAGWLIIEICFVSPYRHAKDLEKKHAEEITDLNATHQTDLSSVKRERDEARTKLSEIDIKKEEIEAMREQAAATKAHVAEMMRQFDAQARENDPTTKAFRAFQEKQVRTMIGLEPESAEFRRRNWYNTLRKEYIATHDKVSPAIVAGTEFPPIDWMNKRIAELNEVWRKRGDSYRLPPMEES